jgi:hypothetical protein
VRQESAERKTSVKPELSGIKHHRYSTDKADYESLLVPVPLPLHPFVLCSEYYYGDPIKDEMGGVSGKCGTRNVCVLTGKLQET